MRNLRLTALAAAVALAATASAAAPAAARDLELGSLRSRGLAGTFVAGGAGSGAIFSNPAAMCLAPVYVLEAGYLNLRPDGSHSVGGSVIDSKSNASYTLGGAYTFGTYDAPDPEGSGADPELGDVVSHDARVGLALPLLDGRAGLGVVAHYRRVTERVLGEDAATDDLSADFTIDAGVHAALDGGVMLGIAAHDLVPSSEVGFARSFEAGAALLQGGLFMGAQWRGELDEHDKLASGFSAGIEYTEDTVPVRVGYRYDALTRHNVLTGGLGFRSKEVGLDLLYEQDLNDTRFFGLGASISGYL
jgi:hypothetical protein